MEKITWTTEKRKTADLKPADYNPRKISERERADLMASIQEFNEVEPVVINTTGRLIGGHQRISIYIDLGIEEIDVRVPSRELTLEEEVRLNLRLNKSGGEWDRDKLKEFDTELLKVVGFSGKELDWIFKDKKSSDDEFDPDASVALIDTPKSKNGDIYKLGGHRLMCGDATIEADVEKLMNGESAQMVFMDPPYNVNYQGGMGAGEKHNRDGIMNDNMSRNSFKEFLISCCRNMHKVCRGGIYICMSSTEMDSLKSAFEETGGHFQSFIIWVKNTFTLSRADFQSRYEPILYGWPKGVVNHYFAGWRDESNVWEGLEKMNPTFDGEKTTIKIGEYHLELDGAVTGKIIRGKDRTDIWEDKKPTKSKEHPTMKPVTLVSKAIRASSDRGNIVLDLFGGSGTTMIAAEEFGRKCYMMELDPRYVDVIINRWEKKTGMMAEKVN